MKREDFRTRLFLSILVCLLSVPSICLAAEKLELITPGEMVVAITESYPPYGFINEKGELAGIAIDVDSEICKRLGLKYKPSVVKWAGLLPSLMAGTIDMISNPMDITEERQKQVTFSNGWIQSGGKMLVKGESAFKSIEEIKGKTVGALYASTWAKLAEESGAKVKYYDGDVPAVQDLINGNIDGVVTDAIVSAYAIQKERKPLRLLPGYLKVFQKGRVFKKGNYNLAKAVNKAVEEMRADGTYMQIMKKYYIDYDPYPEKPILTLFN